MMTQSQLTEIQAATTAAADNHRELQAICKHLEISAKGSKVELFERINARLAELAEPTTEVATEPAAEVTTEEVAAEPAAEVKSGRRRRSPEEIAQQRQANLDLFTELAGVANGDIATGSFKGVIKLEGLSREEAEVKRHACFLAMSAFCESARAVLQQQKDGSFQITFTAGERLFETVEEAEATA